MVTDTSEIDDSYLPPEESDYPSDEDLCLLTKEDFDFSSDDMYLMAKLDEQVEVISKPFVLSPSTLVMLNSPAGEVSQQLYFEQLVGDLTSAIYTYTCVKA